MIGRSPTPSCVKCGQAVPRAAAFCPNCGTQVHDLTFVQPEAASAETLLPPPAPTSLPPPAPTSATGVAITIGPTGIQTSLDNPSRPAVRHGDGPFQPGQQISARYTILKLLGAGGTGEGVTGSCTAGGISGAGWGRSTVATSGSGAG